MSARFLSWAFEVELREHPRVGRTAQRIVLALLANFANDDGEAWPAVGTIAKRACLSTSTARSALNALVADGLVQSVGRRSGGRTPTRWSLQPTDHRRVDESQPTDHRRVTHRPSVPRAPTDTRNPPTIGADPLVTRMEPAMNRGRAHNATAPGPAPGASRRRSGDGAARSKRSTSKTDLRQRADDVVRPWWERQHPRPAQPFIAIVKVAEGALRAGWGDSQLAEALDEVPVVSGGALDVWRHRAGNGRDRGPAGVDLDNALLIADALRQDRERRNRQ